MTAWEYLIVSLPEFEPARAAQGESSAVTLLNREGDSGWEAVGMTALPDAGFAVLLKRPVVVGQPARPERLAIVLTGSDSRCSASSALAGYPLCRAGCRVPASSRGVAVWWTARAVRSRSLRRVTAQSTAARRGTGRRHSSHPTTVACNARPLTTLALAGERVVDAPFLAHLATGTAMSDSRVLACVGPNESFELLADGRLRGGLSSGDGDLRAVDGVVIEPYRHDAWSLAPTATVVTSNDGQRSPDRHSPVGRSRLAVPASSVQGGVAQSWERASMATVIARISTGSTPVLTSTP